MTTPIEFAAELEALAVQIVELPGVSRTRPHAFAEAKSELAGLCRRRALELRTTPSASMPAVIVPGVRRIGQRRVLVEVRRTAV